MQNDALKNVTGIESDLMNTSFSQLDGLDKPIFLSTGDVQNVMIEREDLLYAPTEESPTSNGLKPESLKTLMKKGA